MKADLVSILDTLDIPIIVVSRDGRIAQFNQAATEVLGLTTSDIGRLPSNVRALNEIKFIEKLSEQVMADGVPSRRELRIGDRSFLLRAAPYPRGEAGFEGAVLTFTNVTAFRASVSQAIQDREFTKTIINTVSQPLVVLDGELRVQTGNRAFYATFGVSREAVNGIPLSALGNHQWTIPTLWESVKASLFENTEFKTREVEGDFKGIGRRTFLFDAFKLPGEAGAMILIGLRDITERKQAEAALYETEQRYRTLFNCMDEGFCILEMIFDEKQKPVDFRFIEVNPAFPKQSGLNDAKGRLISELSNVIEQNWFDIFGKIALTGEPARLENHGAAFNRWYELYAFRVEPPEARRVGVVFNDITERKRQQELLETTVAERTVALRETVGELEAFSYSIAHDMRAPLRGMQGFANILMEDHGANLDAQGKDYLHRIIVSARRLDRLIQDVLNYSKIVKAQITIEPVDLDRLTRDIVETYPGWQSPQAEIQIQGTLPKVLGNEAFLTQCISNLLSNAIKFVSPGTVPRIRIWAEDIIPSDSSPQVRIYFHDNGIGIAPAQHARIFRMFERLHPTTAYDGTGIGLTVARRAAERMGGSMGFESALGNGSKFWIQLNKG
jgi:signal transduction histidine kinase